MNSNYCGFSLRPEGAAFGQAGSTPQMFHLCGISCQGLNHFGGCTFLLQRNTCTCFFSSRLHRICLATPLGFCRWSLAGTEDKRCRGLLKEAPETKGQVGASDPPRPPAKSPRGTNCQNAEPAIAASRTCLKVLSWLWVPSICTPAAPSAQRKET